MIAVLRELFDFISKAIAFYVTSSPEAQAEWNDVISALEVQLGGNFTETSANTAPFVRSKGVQGSASTGQNPNKEY